MRPIALVFEAADGRPLAATVLEPRRVEGAVVIASATGVPRRIYEGVAGCLADAGLAVLTFDYRGIGGSRRGRLAAPRDGTDAGLGAARPRGCAPVDAPGVRRRSADAPRAQRGWPAHRARPVRPPPRRRGAGGFPARLGRALAVARAGGHVEHVVRAHSRPDLGDGLPADADGSARARTSPPASPGSGRPGAGGATTSSTRWARRSARPTRGCASRCGRSTSPTTSTLPGAGWRPWSPSTEGAARSTPSPPPRREPPRIGHFGWVRPRFEEAIWAPIRDWFLERLLPSPLRRVG